nr:hypothetical protein [uncultured Pseudokineococcus sp.]
MEQRVGRGAQHDVFAGELADHAESGFDDARVDRPACLHLPGVP